MVKFSECSEKGCVELQQCFRKRKDERRSAGKDELEAGVDVYYKKRPGTESASKRGKDLQAGLTERYCNGADDNSKRRFVAASAVADTLYRECGSGVSGTTRASFRPEIFYLAAKGNHDPQRVRW